MRLACTKLVPVHADPDFDIYEQHARLEQSAGPTVDWTYIHGGRSVLVQVAFVPWWPELHVRLRPEQAEVEIRGTFSPTGRLREVEFVALSDRAEVTTADMRGPFIRALHEWEAVGRQVARQLISGVSLDKTVIDARTPTEALRMINQAAARKRPRTIRRGSSHAEVVRQVAEAYREEIAAGNTRPRLALAERFGYTPQHIGALLMQARKPRNGHPPLLGPADPGRASEGSLDG